MTTRQVQLFQQKNAISKVVFAELRTIDNRPIRNQFDKVGQTVYRFEDGTVMSLSTYDLQNSPNFKPTWKI